MNNLFVDDAGKLALATGEVVTPTEFTAEGFSSTGIDDNAVSTAMTINASNNVVIGTAIPLGKLHVKQPAQQTSFTGATIGVIHVEGTTAADDYSAITFDSSSSLPGAKVGYKQTASGGELHFGTTNNFGAGITNEAMMIDPSGNVGIDELAPDYLLDVNGAIGFAPGASVTPVDNGDVVFEATDNTTFTVKLKGSDGTVRSGTITLS